MVFNCRIGVLTSGHVTPHLKNIKRFYKKKSLLPASRGYVTGMVVFKIVYVFADDVFAVIPNILTDLRIKIGGES